MKRVRPGERIATSASDWNQIVDAVEAWKKVGGGFLGGPLLGSMNRQAQVLVRNDGEDPVPRFGVLAANGPLIAPEDRLEEWLNRPGLAGVAPVGRVGLGTVLIAQAPIGVGRIGPCTLAGVSMAKVKVLDTRHRYADTTDGEPTLVSAWSGPVRIIHLAADAPESGPDVRPALVAFEPGPSDFEAVISDTPVQDGTNWKWSYPITERIPKADGTFITSAPGLRTGNAYNILEGGNVTDSAIAPGVLASDYPDVDIDCLPIAEGTPVVVTEIWPDGWEPGDPPLYRISVANAPKAPC